MPKPHPGAKTFLRLALVILFFKVQPALASPGDTIVQTRIQSRIMNEEREVIIHLPRHYYREPARRYPVMYVLDGTSQDEHTAIKLDILSDAGLAPAAIVVGLPNTRGNRDRDQTPPFMRRNIDDRESPYGGADLFLSFIEKELIPFIDSSYRTSKYRTISGNSRGGLFVLYTLLERPALFQARFCYSTPVWRFDSLIVKKVDAFLKKTPALQGFLYMSAGANETERIRNGLKYMAAVLNKNHNRTFRWVIGYTPHMSHEDNALVSTSRGLVEWGQFLKIRKN